MKLKIFNVLLLLLLLQLILVPIYAEDEYGCGNWDICDVDNINENIYNQIDAISEDYFDSEKLEDNVLIYLDSNLYDTVWTKYYTESSTNNDFFKNNIESGNIISTSTVHPDSIVYTYNNINTQGDYYFGRDPKVITQEYLEVIDYSTDNDSLNIDKFNYNVSTINSNNSEDSEEFNINLNYETVAPELNMSYRNDSESKLSSLKYLDGGSVESIDTYSCIGCMPCEYLGLENKNFEPVSDEFYDSYEGYKENFVNDSSALMLRHNSQEYVDGEKFKSDLELSYYIDGVIYYK